MAKPGTSRRNGSVTTERVRRDDTEPSPRTRPRAHRHDALTAPSRRYVPVPTYHDDSAHTAYAAASEFRSSAVSLMLAVVSHDEW